MSSRPFLHVLRVLDARNAQPHGKNQPTDLSANVSARTAIALKMSSMVAASPIQTQSMCLTVKIYKSLTPDPKTFGRDRLKRAYKETMNRLDSEARNISDIANLRRSYASDFHPDKIAPGLRQDASDFMAQVNRKSDELTARYRARLRKPLMSGQTNG